MRNRKLLIVVASVGLLGWALFLGEDKHGSRKDEMEPRAESQGRETVPKSSPSSSPRGLETVSDFENHLDLRQAAREQAFNEWRTPIEFYGKVIDEKGAPVAQAQVTFSVTDLSQEGHSIFNTISDEEGRFSLGGIKGKHMIVSVTKEGYLTSKDNKRSFSYAGENENFVPNSDERIIFHLYKQKAAEPLIHVVFPGFGRIFQLPGSGKTISFDLLEGKQVLEGQGHVETTFVAGDRGPRIKTFDWKWNVRVPNGGLLLSTNEFDFIAPESGYEKSFEVQMTEGDTNWMNEIERAFFVKFENGTYGRIIFRLMAHNGVFKFESFVNPSGSTNLEFDPAVQR